MGEYKRQLMTCMIEHGISTPEMMQAGLKKMRADPKPFLPSPGEFCEACKPAPEDLGLPLPERAYQIARSEVGKAPELRTWPHAIAKAAKGLQYELKGAQDGSQIERDLRISFINKYKRIVAEIVDTGVNPILDQGRQIERQNPKRASAEVADKTISSLMGMFDND